ARLAAQLVAAVEDERHVRAPRQARQRHVDQPQVLIRHQVALLHSRRSAVSSGARSVAASAAPAAARPTTSTSTSSTVSCNHGKTPAPRTTCGATATTRLTLP